MRFSQKMGFMPIRESIQIGFIDEILENKLWNSINVDFFDKISDKKSPKGVSPKDNVCTTIFTDFFEGRIDEIPKYNGQISILSFMKNLKNWFFYDSEWYEKYDFIEFIARIDSHSLNMRFAENCNRTLEQCLSGYRIINDSIIQITSEQEIVEIEEAFDRSSKWTPVNTHLKTAINYLSNRENPEFRNSIKESISSIEALCGIISKNEALSLGKALKVIGEKNKLHNSLVKAFTSLYGFTSDSGGIRHSLTEDDIHVSFEDAKFMLVACSAFINYLIAKFEK